MISGQRARNASASIAAAPAGGTTRSPGREAAASLRPADARLRSRGSTGALIGAAADAVTGQAVVAGHGPPACAARLERNGVIQQRTAHQHRLEQHLLLPASTKPRLELRQIDSMRSTSAADHVSRCVSSAARLIAQSWYVGAEEHGELRAQDIRERCKEHGEIHARVGQPATAGKMAAASPRAINSRMLRHSSSLTRPSASRTRRDRERVRRRPAPAPGRSGSAHRASSHPPRERSTRARRRPSGRLPAVRTRGVGSGWQPYQCA